MINSDLNATMQKLDVGKKFKIVIFSHGLAANRQLYTVFTNNLASLGFIVFSLEHYEDIYVPE